jgi:hypothetical protein
VKKLREVIVLHPVAEKNLSVFQNSFWFSRKRSRKTGGQTVQKNGFFLILGEGGIPDPLGVVSGIRGGGPVSLWW